jgi:transcription antitermination factor NusG
MDEGPWHVLHVIANHEKTVAARLAARSLEHYLPLYREQSRRADRRVTLDRPLFTGYVFVRFAPQNRSLVIATRSVLRILGDTDKDTVSAREIGRIRDSLTNGYHLLPHPPVSVGMRVRVHGGFFDHAVGVIRELRQQCKVVLGLSAVQQSFSLEVGCDDLEVLSETEAPFGFVWGGEGAQGLSCSETGSPGL